MADDTERRSSIPRRREIPRESAVLSRKNTVLAGYGRRSDVKNVLGTGFKEQRRVAFTKKDRLAHTHIVGSTGTGKSKFMELLMRSDLSEPKSGFCLIDPHGSLYDEMLLYISHRSPALAERVILFNPAGEQEQILGFNPIPPNAMDSIDYVLEMMISGCLKAWGQDDTDRTPRISKWLENLFLTVIANNLTLVETAPLLSISNRYEAQRSRLLANVSNELVLDDWEMFETSTNTQKQTLIEGAANRLRKFLRNEAIRNMIGQQEHVLNLQTIMDEGKILLVNLNGADRISFDNTRLVGIMLVNELFRVAKLRDPRDPQLRPFFLYIDEFANFITRDIARALEECRKFRLFLILAHQHLAQLRDEDEYLYASVLTNCRNRVVFGGLSREDAEIMTQEVSTGFHDLKAIKDEVYTTKVRHHEETRVVRGVSHSNSAGESSSETTSAARTEGSSEALAQSKSESVTDSETHGSAQSLGRTQGRTETHGSTTGTTETSGSSHGITKGFSDGHTQGTSHTDGTSHTHGTSSSQHQGESGSETHGTSDAHGSSRSTSQGGSTGSSQSTSNNNSFGDSITRNSGDGSRSDSRNMASGSANNFSQGTTHGSSDGTSQSHTDSHSKTSGWSKGSTQGQSESHGESHSDGTQESTSHTDSESTSEVETNSHARQQSRSESLADSTSRTETETRSQAQSHAIGKTTGETTTRGTSHSETTGSSTTNGTSSSRSDGQSESVVPFLRPEQYSELSSRTFWTIPELEYMETACMKNQDTGVAFIKVGSAAPIQTKIEHVQAVRYSPRFSPKRIDAFRQRVFRNHPECYLPVRQAIEIQQTRQIAVFGEPVRFDEKPAIEVKVSSSDQEPDDDLESPFAHDD